MTATCETPSATTEAARLDPAALVEEYGPRVRTMAEGLLRGVYGLAVADVDDLAQEGFLAIAEAAGRYEVGRVKFWSFAYPRVWGAMVDYLRGIDFLTRQHRAAIQATGTEPPKRFHIGQLTNERYLAASEGADKVQGLYAPRHCDPEHADDATAEFAATVRRLCPSLSRSTRLLLARYFVDGATMKRIGLENGVSESRMSQIIAHAVTEIRNACEARGRTAQTALA